MAKLHSQVSYQVMWNRLISVVEEQAQALVRTAFSTSVREAGDLSAGVYDLHGQMLAQAVTGTPGHVNAMADAVGHFIRRIGRDNIFEGDVYITNDPWKVPVIYMTLQWLAHLFTTKNWLVFLPVQHTLLI